MGGLTVDTSGGEIILASGLHLPNPAVAFLALDAGVYGFRELFSPKTTGTPWTENISGHTPNRVMVKGQRVDLDVIIDGTVDVTGTALAAGDSWEVNTLRLHTELVAPSLTGTGTQTVQLVKRTGASPVSARMACTAIDEQKDLGDALTATIRLWFPDGSPFWSGS